MDLKLFKVIRPHVPQITLFHLLGERVSGRFTRPAARFPVNVQYFDQAGKRRTVEVRRMDLPHLVGVPASEANEHLELILQARGGNTGAQAVLIDKVVRDCVDYTSRFANPPRIPEEFTPYIVPFNAAGEYSPQLISDKGFWLMRLHRLGYPVPAFCVLTSNYREVGWGGMFKLFDCAQQTLEWLTGKRFNHPDNPLVFSIRSGPNENQPGMLPTYLNMGVSRETFPALVRRYGEETATDIFIGNLMTLLLDADPNNGPTLRRLTSPYPQALEGKRALLGALMQKSYAPGNTYVTFTRPDALVSHFIDRINHAFMDELDALRTVTESGECPSYTVILQEMIFGRAGKSSYSGVYFTHAPKWGSWPQLEVAFNSPGEDLMTGSLPMGPERVRFTLKPDASTFPPVEVAAYSEETLRPLAGEFRHPARVELTVQNGELAVLQASRAELTAPAVFGFATEAVAAGRISGSEVLEMIQSFHVRQLFADQIVDKRGLKLAAKGVSILAKSDACGRAYFSNEAALAAKARGEKVILIKLIFQPADVEAGKEADGIVSIDPMGIHAATIARRVGKPVLIALKQVDGEKVRFNGKSLTMLIDGQEAAVREGDEIAICSEENAFYVGQAQTLPSDFDERTADRKLWMAYSAYKEMVLRILPHEVLSIKAMNNLVSFLMFLGEEGKLQEIVNGMFELQESMFVEYYAVTDIGKHLPRINAFRALTEGNQRRLFSLLLEKLKEAKVGEGTFILGRLLLSLEEEKGEACLKAFIGEHGEDAGRLVQEVERARDYLQKSRVAPPAAEQSAAAVESASNKALDELMTEMGEAWVEERGLKGNYDMAKFYYLCLSAMGADRLRETPHDVLLEKKRIFDVHSLAEHKPVRVIRDLFKLR